MACVYIFPDGKKLSVADMDDYLKSLPHETLAKYSPVVAALLGESSSGASTSSIVAQVKSWLPKRVQGMLDSGKLRLVQSVNDLPAHLREAGAAMLHTVWHGTPHDFDKFDLSHRGTGEGANKSNGSEFTDLVAWGHYVSDLKEIGEYYRKLLTDSFSEQKFKWNGETYTRKTSPQGHALGLINDVGIPQAKKIAKSLIGTEGMHGYPSGYFNILNNVVNAITNKKQFEVTRGALYEAEVSISEDEYLNWESPISKQSDIVKSAILRFVGENTEYDFDFSKTTGQDFYKGILSKALGSERLASEYLNNAGVKGVMYKVGEKKSKAHNYVIFSDDDITITNKYSKLNGIQGLYDAKTDTTYLVADMLTKDNTNIVLSHELFHRFYATDPKAKAIMGKMMFGARESFDQASRGKGTKTELSAYQRVINAKTPEKDQIEEYLAYQISSFLENPKNVTPTLANLIKNWIASIRMALLRYGMDMGFVRSLTPRDLVALSQYGARVDAIANPQGDAVLMKASKAGYEGSDTGEAFEWLRAVAKGLDMSQEARMARAKAMGYDTDTIYYNGSHEPVTELREKTYGENIFDGLFLSTHKNVARNFGSGIINEFIARDEFVIDNLENDDTPYSEVINYLQGRYPDATDEQIEDIIYPAIVEDKDVFRMDEDEVLSVTGSDDLGEASWEFQNERGLLAKHLGYDIVSMDDENGTSYFAPYGSKIRSINAAFDPDFADSPNLLASFAGENAQTADKYQLATAKERLANGEDKEVVRRDTGWFMDAKDKRWKFEIDDSDASLKDKSEWNPNLSKLQDKYNAARERKDNAEESRNAFLRERGESPTRIKPETKKMPEFMALNKDFKLKASAAEKARDAVTIQSNKGTEITVGTMLNHPALFSAYPDIANIRVSIDKKMPATDASYTKEFNKIELSSNSSQEQVLSNLLHEIQHAIQSQEGFASGGNPEQFNYTQAQKDEFTKIEDALVIKRIGSGDGVAEGIKRFTEMEGRPPIMGAAGLADRTDVKKLAEMYQQVKTKLGKPEDNNHVKYEKLAGEIEARNTQARLGLTAEQRRNTPIADTQDIPDSEAIVVWNGETMNSSMPPANADNGVRFSVASSAVDYLTNQPRNVTSASDLQNLIDSKKLPKQKRFNADSIIENFVDSSHPLRVWSRILPDTLAANKMLDNFDRASGVKATIEKQAAIKFKRQISASIKDFAKEQGVNFDVAMEIIGNWASMRYALESGQKWIYTDTEMTALKSDIETKFGKTNLEQAIQPVLDMNQWRLSELDDKEGKLSGADLANLQTPNYVPLLDNHAINDSYAELENSAKFVGFKDFRNSLKTIHKGLFDDIKVANPALSNDEINAKIKADYELNKTKKGVSITNPAAQLAMTDLSNEAVPSILKPIAAFTRFQSKIVTAFLVGFAPTNMIRDVEERTENLRTRTVAGHESVDMNSVANQAIKRSAGLLYNIKKVMMNVLAEGTILEDKFKADNTNPDVQDFREYLKLGASSTYGDLLADDKQGLAKELKKVGSIPHKAMDVLLLWNNAFEMISGFSAYQSMVAHGIDKKSAAATSLNLMNFRKRGKVMSPLRALYMFAQPIAIGGHQLAKTLSTRRGLMRLAAYTVASMVLYSLLRGFDDDDDELGYNRMDESSNFSLYRNIRIPLGGGEYVDIPIGFGMQQLAWSHGVNFVRTALGTMTTGEMLGESALLWVKSTAPVSPAEGSIMKNPAVYLAQTFTPQVARPVMNVALDVNAFMSPLTNSRYERTDKAKALQGRANTPQEYKDIAEVLGKAGIDMYPEQIRELMRGYGAGLFNEAIKYFIENPAKEDKGLETVSPLIDRWIKVSNDDQIKQKLYYNARDKMNAASVAKSNGAELTSEESKLAELGDTLKKREASTRGKFAAATKAEKAGQLKRAELLRKVADMQRNKYMDFAFEKMKEITG